MTAMEIALVQQKLARISEYLRLLKPIAQLSFDEYCAQVYQRKAAERLLQTVIEAAIDINNHLLVGSGFPPADSYHQSFFDLALKVKAIELSLAEELAPSAGLRNRLVREYDQLDDAAVFGSIRRALTSYPRYVQAVQAYLSNLKGYN